MFYQWQPPCDAAFIMLDHVAGGIERYMSLLGARQRAVASNIANADTPGYKTRDVDFRTELRNLLQSGSPNTIEVPELPARNDGNNVNLEREARLLSENALRFNLASQLARLEVRSVRSALQEGRGV